MKWVRDGTIFGTGHTEIDLRTTRAYRGEHDWIEVKSDSDRRAERIAARLLRFLNAPTRRRKRAST